MAQATINPYLIIGEQHYGGLTYLENLLGFGLNFNALNSLVFSYIQPLYYPPTPPPPPDQFISNQLMAVGPTAVNSYVNGLFDHYNDAQLHYINMLLGNIISNVPIESIQEFISDMEDNITKSGLTTEEQIPLFMAMAVGIRNYDYWQDVINGVPGTGNWLAYNYIDPNMNINRTNLPYWVQAAMQATLTSANSAKTYGLIDPPRIIGVDMVAGLTGSIVVAAGKVMFKWIPRVKNIIKEQTNKEGEQITSEMTLPIKDSGGNPLYVKKPLTRPGRGIILNASW